MALWNPASPPLKIRVLEIGLHQSAGIAVSQRVVLQRISTRGTPGITHTPDIDNDWDHERAPPSGALLDLAAYSVQPTFEAEPFWGVVPSAASGSSIAYGWVWSSPDGIWIKPGAGLAYKQIEANAYPLFEPYVVWEEGGGDY